MSTNGAVLPKLAFRVTSARPALLGSLIRVPWAKPSWKRRPLSIAMAGASGTRVKQIFTLSMIGVKFVIPVH